MANYQKISDVKSSIVWRLFGVDEEIDWLYGSSRWNFHDSYTGTLKETFIYGMPVGKISIWAGEGGVGKSRLAINIAKKVVAKYKPNTVLYFQNEVDIATFANWVNDNKVSNFYYSSATSLQEQVEIIKEIKPDLVFVDSINLIEEFGSGTDSSIKTIMDAYREAIKETNTETRKNTRSSTYAHVVFLCQLSKDGSAKGATALTHLPDTTITITKQDNYFKVAIGKKHRYGRTGDELYSLWRHTDTGVECISKNRTKDPQWCKDTKYVAPVVQRYVVQKPVVLTPKPKKTRCSAHFYECLEASGFPNLDSCVIDPNMTKNYEGQKPLTFGQKAKIFWQAVKRDTFKW